MHSVLYTFDDEKIRDNFILLVNNFINFTITESQDWVGPDITTTQMPTDAELEQLLKAIQTAQKDPELKGINETTSKVFVGNKLVYEGMYKDASARWESEVNSHSAKVELKSYKGGTWKTIRLRK